MFVSAQPVPSIIAVEESENEIYVAVAENPSTPIKTLHKLTKVDNIDVRAGIAKNQSTPIEILVDFVSDYLWNY